jgi:hypothetical protein
MVEIVVIAKSIIARIVRRINIDELYFASETISESVECDEIIAFDQEIGAKLSLAIEEFDLLGTRDLMITTRVDTSKTSEDLSLLKCINI